MEDIFTTHLLLKTFLQEDRIYEVKKLTTKNSKLINKANRLIAKVRKKVCKSNI